MYEKGAVEDSTCYGPESFVETILILSIHLVLDDWLIALKYWRNLNVIDIEMNQSKAITPTCKAVI